MGLFSRQNKVQERYVYTISPTARSRIIHIFHQHKDDHRYDVRSLRREVVPKLSAAYGGLVQNRNPPPYDNTPEWIGHAMHCGDDLFMDFLQLCFECDCLGRATPYTVHAVEKINRVFEEEGIGYEMSIPTVEITETPASYDERGYSVPAFTTYSNWEFSKPLKKTERSDHEIVVKPALDLLSKRVFVAANKELLAAFDDMKKGHYADAVTSCGACFESVMKIICKARRWAYNETDACARLVAICQSNGLFHSFYTEMLVGVGRIRNKIGDAHGKGPTPEFPPATKVEAEHMIATTCSHVGFLIKQAGL
jgi:hypothetical protein